MASSREPPPNLSLGTVERRRTEVFTNLGSTPLFSEYLKNTNTEDNLSGFVLGFSGLLFPPLFQNRAP